MVECRAELGVLPTVDPDVGPDSVTLADRGPPVTKRRPVHRHSATHNGDEPAARLEPQEGLLKVSRAERRAVAVYSTAGGGKRRVHHDGMVTLFGREQIVQSLGIKRHRLKPQ